MSTAAAPIQARAAKILRISPDLKVLSSPPLQAATVCTARLSKLQLTVATSLQGYMALSPFFDFEPVEACNYT
jgi:hypothetical protein